MSSNNLLKITCHLQDSRINSYIKMPSPTFAYLKRELETNLFTVRQIPSFEMRLYWIDSDNDEVEIISQSDYEVFTEKFAHNSTHMHMHIAMLNQKISKGTDAAIAANNSETQTNPDDPSFLVIHDNVSCDFCGLDPLVGYRYKCVQCPNYDLCQNCEAEHRHPEHMMVRMPRNDCPRVVDAWVSNWGSRRRTGGGHHKRSKGQCPFMDATAACGATKEAEVNAESAEQQRHHHHHGRKHHKRQTRNGFFTGLYDMMQDLAENSGPVTNAAVAAATAAAEEAAKAAEVAIKTAVNTASTAANPTSTAASSTQNATSAQESQTEPMPEAKKATEQPSTGADGKTADKTDKAETPTTPVINYDSLSQIVRPEYMRAGIEILNNFSEMFAKMLDPVDGGADDLPPRTANPSSSSSTSSSATSSGITTPKDAAPTPASAPIAAKETQIPPAVATGTKPKTRETTSPMLVEKNTEPTATASDLNKSRANSEDGDWQMIDDSQSFVAASTSASDNNLKNPFADAAGQESSAAQINFEKLSEDLRAHIAEEKARDEQQRQQNVSNAESQTTQEPTVSTSIASTNTSDLPAPPQQANRAPHVYHWDSRINDSVKVMMAMGFSNEGAWLTQLLESVEGNISAALDIMSNTQREANKSN